VSVPPPDEPTGRDRTDELDPLDAIETPLSRLARHGRRLLAAVIAVALLVPAGSWLVDEIRFRTSGTEVLETLSSEDPAGAVAEAVLLVGVTGCEPGERRSGSAFAVDTGERVVLVTNRHVVDRARQVSVRAIDSIDAITVVEVQVSDAADVAVLELADPDAVPPALTLHRGVIERGRTVRLVGFPAALPFTAQGVVAETDPSRLLLDLPADRGASGSPVIDEDGLVVGQLFAVTSGGLGVATPVDRLLTAIDQLRPSDRC
jgi:S1-C subfamily serine protease